MSATRINVDRDLLMRAARVLGTPTEADTVNEALRLVVEQEARQRHVDELASGALPDLTDAGVMAAAWR